LAKVCGMLGSAYEGERANAAAAADALIKTTGLSWAAVLGVAAADLCESAQVGLCQEHRDLLTAWERRFIEGVAKTIYRGRPLSKKQASVLPRIHAAVRERV
jgi:hypothetical protein